MSNIMPENASSLIPYLKNHKVFQSCYKHNLCRYEFKLCANSETNLLVDFFRKQLNKNHIYVNSPELLRWQYYNEKTEEFFIVIAKEKKTGEIHAAHCFIPISLFSKNNDDIQYIWGSLWIARFDVGADALGLSTLYYIIDRFKPIYYGGIGMSAVARKITAKIGFTIGPMNHYYIPNDNIDNSIISFDKNKWIDTNHSQKVSKFSIITIEDFTKLDEAIFESKNMPPKNKDFFDNRYFKHPFYKYLALYFSSENNSYCIVFLRKIHVYNYSVLRIVDISGDLMAMKGALSSFQNLLQIEGSEYIDVLNFGIEQDLFFDAGFQLKNEEDIIPEYFEPFEKKNIKLECSYLAKKSDISNVVFFKGDGDQDRPNIISKS